MFSEHGNTTRSSRREPRRSMSKLRLLLRSVATRRTPGSIGSVWPSRNPARSHGSLRGRAIGLLGPNGAGKSTLINTLLGFYKPSSGSARVFGYDIRTETQANPQSSWLHAGKRRVHLENECGLFRSHDGGTFGPAFFRGAGAGARGIVLRGTGGSALSQAGNVFPGHEAAGQAGAGDRARAQAADSR